MRRMAYVSGAALLAALAVGCSSGGGTSDPPTDTKPGGTTPTAAAPGKYRTLPEPCRAVGTSTLKDLLPGAATLPEDQQEKVYRGTAAVTYDTDRRVGCGWKAEAPDSSRSLSVDFERVVSYDSAVSDDDRAAEVYAKKETAADLPAGSASSGGSQNPTPSGSPTTGGATTGTPGGDGPAASGSLGQGLSPRVLTDLGDSAYLDDQLDRGGSSAEHRTVSVVFRTSNVIVTVEYTEQPGRTGQAPDSGELQDKAQAVARSLVDKFSE